MSGQSQNLSGIFHLRVQKLIVVLSVFSSALLLGGCALPSFEQANGGIRVTTNPASTVFVDDQQVGVTPYESNKMAPGEVSLRLVPQATAGATLAAWEGKIRLTPGIQTIVGRDFAETLAQSSGYVLTLDRIGGKRAAISVVSTPDAAAVKIDGGSQGFTPVALESVGEGDHQVLLTAPGYADKLVTMRAVAGLRSVLTVQLAQLAQPPTSTGSATASGSSVLSGQSREASPTPKASLPPKPYVQVSNTPTGWLRVRTDPSLSATEAAKVNSGQAFPYKDTSADNNWYQIEYQPGSLGWISVQYAKKVE